MGRPTCLLTYLPAISLVKLTPAAHHVMLDSDIPPPVIENYKTAIPLPQTSCRQTSNSQMCYHQHVGKVQSFASATAHSIQPSSNNSTLSWRQSTSMTWCTSGYRNSTTRGASQARLKRNPNHNHFDFFSLNWI